jgi:Arc/MetJ family transcription regulator
MIFVISVVAIMVPVLIGIVLAFATARLDTVVAETKTAVENVDKGYNPAVTLGHRIKVAANVSTQLQEARVLAAKRAAVLPRGANMRIGRLGHENLRTASQALEEDPLSAVRIAAFHDWDGARAGAPAGGVPAATAAAPAAPAAAPAADGKIELVPGRDYPVVEVTDAMSGSEKRKTRIANAKAKAAAMKAAKEAGAVSAAAPAAAATAAAPSPTARAAAPAVPAGISEPEYIEITDEMAPDEVRKARIANAKAKSAYNKALKAAGIDPSAVEGGEVVAPATPEPAPAAAPAAAATAPAIPANIEPPQFVEITDDMPPDEIRRARIANAKAKSEFNKALKAAGIDPSTVDVESGKVVAAAPAKDPTAGPAATSESPQAVTPAEPTPATTYEPVAIPAGVPKPDYIEITDDMAPEAVRRARIHNSKERSAYNKALKAAGIDPKSIPENA